MLRMDSMPWPGGRRLPGRVLLLCLALLPAACSTPGPRNDVRGEVRECADPGSPACAAAREGFQLVRYPTMGSDRLVAAASRALGDLNFEAERDDARRHVDGSYVAAAPVHDKQLDELFRKTLKGYAPDRDLSALSAQVDVLPIPDRDVGGNVRLQLFLAGADGTAQPVDSVGPYQIFFRQLGIELGAPAAPVEEDSDRKKRKPQLAPSISGV
ncbi:MAG TPA: hypothetical protein VFA75_03555 [Nevskia sp.]|nr:hypothetical protein [Nevskia sp.]